MKYNNRETLHFCKVSQIFKTLKRWVSERYNIYR
nr:MAG TPA: hypothetical protein [Caudoviricetes sp.]